jgi:hypothetical protein
MILAEQQNNALALDLRTDQGERIVYLTRKRREMIFARWQDDPTIIDSIGFAQTRRLALQWLNQMAAAYYSLWEKTPGQYNEYCAQLKTIKSEVISDVRKLWRSRRGWIDRVWLARSREVGIPSVEDDLEAAVKTWNDRARAAELHRLDRDQISEDVPPAGPKTTKEQTKGRGRPLSTDPETSEKGELARGGTGQARRGKVRRGK